MLQSSQSDLNWRCCHYKVSNSDLEATRMLPLDVNVWCHFNLLRCSHCYWTEFGLTLLKIPREKKVLKHVSVFFLACNYNFNILSAPHQRGSKKEGTGREKILYFSYSKWMICSNHINTSWLKPRVKSSTLLITALKAHVYLRIAAAWRLSLLAQLEQLALIACQHKQKQGADGNLTWLKLWYRTCAPVIQRMRKT